MCCSRTVDNTFVDRLSAELLALKEDSCKCNALDEHSTHGKFFSNALPSISLAEYIMRIDKGTDSSSNFDLFLCTFVLIKRYFVVATSLSICRSKISLHRLLLTAFTIANKAYSDTFYMNAYYAVLGGISVEELDEHESDFLQFVDWEILIHKPEIDTLVERFSAAFGE